MPVLWAQRHPPLSDGIIGTSKPKSCPNTPRRICAGWYFWVGIGSIAAPIDISVSISNGNLLGKLIANYLPSRGKLLHRSQMSPINSGGWDTGGLGTSGDGAASSSRVRQRMARGGDARKERKRSN